jgi:hypothetical protein
VQALPSFLHPVPPPVPEVSLKVCCRIDLLCLSFELLHTCVCRHCLLLDPVLTKSLSMLQKLLCLLSMVSFVVLSCFFPELPLKRIPGTAATALPFWTQYLVKPSQRYKYFRIALVVFV